MNSPMNTYTYSILKFIPDMRTGELINVGLAVHSAVDKNAIIKCRTTFGRITKLNHEVDGHGLIRTLKNITTEFRELTDQASQELQFEQIESVATICNSILPRDDSALQWSPVKYSKCKDLRVEINRLYDRFVSYADEDKTQRKTEDEIWRIFNKDLETRNLVKFLKPKKFQTQDDEVEFDHTIKNGIWHCIQPVSFDLLHSTSIKDKAHKWLGQIASVSDSSENFKVYFLLAEPTDSSLNDSYRNAKSILQKIPGESSLYSESESDQLLDELESVCAQ